jgi:hypothetical protein
MTQYKIQVGSWTKLPSGEVQEDTRAIMKMMAGKVGGEVEGHVAIAAMDNWQSIGVNDKLTIKVYMNKDYASQALTNKQSLFIPYEELQKMLNTPTVHSVPSLLNTKLDCRKADGTVDEELSRAFQEACFEQGVKWCGKYNEIRHLEKSFLYVEDGDCLYYSDEVTFKYFKNHSNKQINFKFSRKLEWEATEVEPDVEDDDGMVDICGVKYSSKELSEALALIKSARK